MKNAKTILVIFLLADICKKVRAESRLNSSHLGRGWFEFPRQLEDKPAWKGCWLLCVVPQNTGRTCPACARIVKENRKTQTRFRWLACGFEEHAELVGAMQSKRAGHARFAGAGIFRLNFPKAQITCTQRSRQNKKRKNQ
jgi:transposase